MAAAVLACMCTLLLFSLPLAHRPPLTSSTPWFTKDTIEGTNRFLEYALSLDGVYAVTVRQVIEWLQVGATAGPAGR